MEKVEKRMPEVGDHVMWHDELGNGFNALVICVFTSGPSGRPSINLVVVKSDASYEDSYGRQTERQTSQVHMSNQTAHGMYWRFPEEEQKPIPV